MDKPRQTKVTYDNNPGDRLNVIENTLYHIAEAMDWLRGYGEYEDAFDTLDDLFGELESEYADLEGYAIAEYNADIAMLTHDYYRSVL